MLVVACTTASFLLSRQVACCVCWKTSQPGRHEQRHFLKQHRCVWMLVLRPTIKSPRSHAKLTPKSGFRHEDYFFIRYPPCNLFIHFQPLQSTEFHRLGKCRSRWRCPRACVAAISHTKLVWQRWWARTLLGWHQRRLPGPSPQVNEPPRKSANLDFVRFVLGGGGSANLDFFDLFLEGGGGANFVVVDFF